tara:strand:+ start:74 stop:637 length:564 start_codon:yes stop_codon:yes gene_type:complete
MVSVASLWLPVLLSAVFVFIASAIIHMALSYHKQDKRPLPDEKGVMDALRPFKIPPGDYIVPHANDMKETSTPEFLEKTKQGPVVLMTVLPNGPMNTGRSLGMWFTYAVLVGVIAGYVTGLTLGPGADYRVVFRIVSTIAFTGYALAILESSIWWYQGWGATLRKMFDGLVYALLTAGTFGWLWPDA